MSDNKRLKIQLLGPPNLWWDGKPLTIQRRMARILLYYLATHKVVQGRYEIMDDFWPEFDNGRQRLRDLLSKLRAELPDPSMIIVDRDLIGLDHTRAQVDVLEFEDLYHQTTLPFLSIENRPLPEAIYQKMVAAANMWQSAQFLSGLGQVENDSVINWVENNNQRLLSMLMDLMERISNHLINASDLEGAIIWLDKLIDLDLDFSHPQAVYWKVDVLFRLQRLPQAYEYAQAVIKEMGYDWFEHFSIPLKSLVEQMETLNRRLPEIITSYMPVHSFQHIPLASQETMLRNLEKAAKRGGIICLQGETGSGKTHLLENLSRQFAKEGRWITFSANLFQQDLPFHPLLHSLRQALSEEDWRSLEPFWGIHLIPLIPECQQFWNISQSYALPPGNNPLSLFEAFHQLFLRLARTARLGLVLDDAHWADPQTLNLLIYLSQHNFFEDKGFLILSFQPNIENPLLRQLLLHQYEIAPFSLMEIDPLSTEEISHISFSFFGKAISDYLIKRIETACGGNILFVIETMRALVSVHGIQEDRPIERIPLPAAVHAILRNRVLALPQTARQVLECAAVIGDPFTFQDLMAVLKMEEIELVHTLEQLQNNNAIRAESAPFVNDKYHFNFGFLKEVVTLETSVTKKQLFHLRLAQSIEEEYRQNPANRLLSKMAFHYSEAGNTSQAFDYWIQLAKYQFTNEYDLLPYSAYHNAQHIVNSVRAQLTNDQLYQLYIGWGEQALYQLDYAIADECFKQATITGQKRSDPLLIGSGYSGLGALFLLQGLPFQAEQYLDQSLNFLQIDHFGEFLRTKTRKAYLLIQNGLVLECLIELEALSKEFNHASTPFDIFMVAEAKFTMALANIFVAQFERAYKLVLEIKQILREYRNLPLQAKVEVLLGRIHYLRGEYRPAGEHLSLSIQISEIYSAWNLAIQAAAFASLVALKQGKIFYSLEQIKNSLHLSEIYHHQESLSILYNAQGRVYLFLGQYAQALELFEKALSFSTLKYDTLLNQKDIGVVHYLLVDPQKGEQNLLDVIGMSAVYGFRMLEFVAQAQLILLRYMNNPHAEAVQELAEMEQEAMRGGFAGVSCALAYLTAVEAIRTETPNVAEKSIQQMLRISQQEDSLWFIWHACELQRQVHQLQGLDLLNDQVACEGYQRSLRQMIPKDIRKNLDFKTPPLAVLV